MQFPEMNCTEVIRVSADDSTVPLEVRPMMTNHLRFIASKFT